METTKKTAHIAEALKHLHIASQHVLSGMAEQLNSADKFMLQEWQPTVEPVEQLLLKLLGDIVNVNALTVAAQTFDKPAKEKNANWAF
jgi:hypothetical protein